MAQKKISLKGLAKILGVSISTVSKALNDSYEISEKTKEKVKNAAKKYNYKPNKLASSLKSGKTKTIGVIIPSIQNNFFAKVLYGIDKIATNEGYNIITCISNESFEKEVDTIEMLSNGSADGFIVAIAEETQIKQNFAHFNTAITQGKSVLLFDRVTNQVICDQVTVNDLEAAYQATNYLIKTFCKKIALVSSIHHLSVGKLRVEGYKKAIKENFDVVNEDYIVTVKAVSLEKSIENLIKKHQIDGILALDEDASLCAIKVSKNFGLRIPLDMSIIGYASEKIAANLSPTLTTINQHGVKIGQSSVQLLLKKIQHNVKGTTHKIIKSTIVKRNSTK